MTSLAENCVIQTNKSPLLVSTMPWRSFAIALEKFFSRVAKCIERFLYYYSSRISVTMLRNRHENSDKPEVILQFSGLNS